MHLPGGSLILAGHERNQAAFVVGYIDMVLQEP